MPSLLQQTQAHLRTLRPGQRAWFWLCPDAPVPLLLSPVATDPLMEALNRQTAWTPRGLTPIRGVVSRGEDGRLSLGSEAMTRALLERLAGWVRSSCTEAPDLAHLRGARGYRLHGNASVAEVLDEPALWEGVPSRPAPGSLAAVAARIQAMWEGERCWIWATAAGPFAVLTSVADDPQLVTLNARVRQRIAYTGTAPDGVCGVLIQGPDGVRLVSRSPEDAVSAVCAALAQAHPDLVLEAPGGAAGLDDLSLLDALDDELADLDAELADLADLAALSLT